MPPPSTHRLLLVAALAGCVDVVAFDAGVDVDAAPAPGIEVGPTPADAGPGPDLDPHPDPDAARPPDARVLDPDARVPAPDAGPCRSPVDETCNGRDDDCDGAVDEGAVCCAANPELCNGIDDDCDGVADEGIECCDPVGEVCNGADDDCDGVADEGAVCCDPVDEVCNDVDDDCDGAVDEDDVCCEPEVCNGLDDDCDGVGDEDRVCGQYVQSNCRLFWGWADGRSGPAGVSPNWAGCPGVDRVDDENIGCTGTRRLGNFARLRMRGDVDDNDQFGFALLCLPGPDPALSAWVQSRCALFVGYADNDNAPPDGPQFGGCPAAVHMPDDLRPCTSTGYDGNFRALNTQGDVDGNDDLSFAWICRDDPARPGLATIVQSEVEVFVGWADGNAPADDAPTWSTCPDGDPNTREGGIRCVGTRGDGHFHKLDLMGDVNGNDRAGIALRVRR